MKIMGRPLRRFFPWREGCFGGGKTPQNPFGHVLFCFYVLGVGFLLCGSFLESGPLCLESGSRLDSWFSPFVESGNELRQALVVTHDKILIAQIPYQRQGFSVFTQPRAASCVFPKIGVSQNGWFIMENPIKMGWFGGVNYTSIFGETHPADFVETNLTWHSGIDLHIQGLIQAVCGGGLLPWCGLWKGSSQHGSLKMQQKLRKMFRPGWKLTVGGRPIRSKGANSDSMIPHESSKGMTSLIHENVVSFLDGLLLDKDEPIHINGQVFIMDIN